MEEVITIDTAKELKKYINKPSKKYYVPNNYGSYDLSDIPTEESLCAYSAKERWRKLRKEKVYRC